MNETKLRYVRLVIKGLAVFCRFLAPALPAEDELAATVAAPLAVAATSFTHTGHTKGSAGAHCSHMSLLRSVTATKLAH